MQETSLGQNARLTPNICVLLFFFFFFFFFFVVVFFVCVRGGGGGVWSGWEVTALSRIFRANYSSKVGENRRTRRKSPDHPLAELGFPTCDPSEARTTAV